VQLLIRERGRNGERVRMQGMGWACLEELRWGDSAHPWIKPGKLATNGPGAYKIPTLNDIPLDFRVTLLQNMAHERAVHSSKAVGEPPFHLGCTVLLALKDAVYSARADAGVIPALPRPGVGAAAACVWRTP
jgi:xanthine dehydrogenase/oxidase